MKVSVIIVNWNTGKLLRECLESLAALPEKDLIAEVTVVDNASSDDSFSQAKSVEIGVPTTLMGLHENIGFAAANNMAIRQRRDKTSHVLLLNPDTQVKSGAIGAGVKEFADNPKTGVAGLHLLNPDGSTQPSVRNLPTLAILVFLFLKLHRLFPRAKAWCAYMATGFNYRERQVVNQVMGAVFFIRQEVLEKIGLLDEKFWVWFEEVDYCQRALAAGWNVIYTPAGEVTHYQAASFSQLVGLRRTLPFLKSSLRYARKHLGVFSWSLLVCLWPLAVLVALPSALRHIRQRSSNQARL